MKANNSLIFEVLNGDNEVISSGYAGEVLLFLEDPKNISRAFWVRQQNDDKKIKCDTWLFLARLVAKALKNKSKSI